MSLERTIVIDSQQKAEAACRFIESNWKPLSDSGHPMASHFHEHKPDATKEQRGLMWIRLDEIASQVWIEGRQYAADCWHEHCKREYLPDEPGPSKRCRKGYRKWDIDPMTGERVLVGSTEGLTTFGKAEYLTQIMAWGATEMGVHFSATPNEMRMAA